MSEQIEDRKQKLAGARELGAEPYGSRFTGVTKNAHIRALGEHSKLEPGQILETPECRIRSAGRVHLFRDTGKLIFMTVRDWTGDIQWAISKKAIEGSADSPSATGGKVGTWESGKGEGAASNAPFPPAPLPTCPPGNAGETPTLPGEAPWPPGVIAWRLAKSLDLGDIVGAEGKLGRTKTGELTLWVDRFRMLSKAVRPPPEKWHGLTDVETRYRKRYVDLLANPDSQRQFVLRARIIDYIRRVLQNRGFIEVETPVLQPIYGGAAARPFTTHHNALDMKLFLRISPELYLKRCLVGGLERVFEFARCFRNEGISPRHNPEFTMLELYQAYGDYHDMMEITEAIIAGAARDVIGTYQIQMGSAGVSPAMDDNAAASTASKETAGIYPASAPRPQPTPAGETPSIRAGETPSIRAGETPSIRAGETPSIRAGETPALPGVIDFTPPWPRRRYADLFAEHVGLSIDDRAAIRNRAAERYRQKQITLDPAKADDAVVISSLFEHYVEDKLINPTFVIDYPAPLCPLTKRHPTDPRYALRFECFVSGMEMGNAYSELNDPKIQHETFSAQLRGEGDTMAIMDEDYVEALEYAMPPAGGLGIGIDRLCMLLTGSESIREVLLFPLQRPDRGGFDQE